jgi:hypothetical protein
MKESAGCRHGHLPPLAGFTGHGKDAWSRVAVTPAAMVRPVSRVLGHRREPDA